MNDDSIIFERYKQCLLIEAQRISISQQQVRQLIDKKDYKRLTDYLYKCLTNNTGWESKLNNITQQDKTAYRTKTETSDKSNPAWAGWTVKSKKDENKSSNNYKLYYSTGDDDAIKIINGIDSLKEKLSTALSQFDIKSASFKIPMTLSGYIYHNYRIVVHFFAKDNIEKIKQQIHQTVQSWANNNKITLHARTHNFGQDEGGNSYGMRIAEHIVKSLKPHVDSGIYNNDQLTAWVIKSFQSTTKDIQVN
jgi:hypothetical protein